MNILISGGSGFVGHNLATKLHALGYNVYSISGGNGNPAVGTVIYRGIFGIADLPEKIDCLFHLAANNDTRYNNLEDIMRINVDDSIHLFNMCFHNGCRTFIYASTAAVYGNSPAPYVEETPVCPLTPYAKSKLRLETEVEKFAKEKNVRTVGLRYCNIYGPGESHKGKRASMIRQLLDCKDAGRRPRLFRDGRQRRDWLHVFDAVDANILAMMNPTASGLFNIGSGVSVSFNEIVESIFGKVDVEWVDCPYLSEYQNHTCCNITKARKCFGFNPQIYVMDVLAI